MGCSFIISSSIKQVKLSGVHYTSGDVTATAKNGKARLCACGEFCLFSSNLHSINLVKSVDLRFGTETLLGRTVSLTEQQIHDFTNQKKRNQMLTSSLSDTYVRLSRFRRETRTEGDGDRLCTGQHLSMLDQIDISIHILETQSCRHVPLHGCVSIKECVRARVGG